MRLRRMVKRMPCPAYVTGQRWDVLAWNAAAAELCGGFRAMAPETGSYDVVSVPHWCQTSAGWKSESAMIWLFLLGLQAASANYDAVAAAPHSHRVLMEDDRIRVLRVEVAPGATEPVHDHRWPSVMYFERPQPITYITYKLVDGRPIETTRVDAPALNVAQTVRSEPEALHAVMNRGSAPFLAVRFEFKDGGPATGAGPLP